MHPPAGTVGRRDEGERLLGRLVHDGIGLPTPNMAADLVQGVPFGRTVKEDLLKES